VRLFVATQPVDGRKGPDSLMALVRDVFRHDPLSGHLFNAIRLFDTQTMLCHQTTADRWPEDADEYSRVTEAAVERLLDRIQHWSMASTFSLDL
jgi:hypothetical protein